MEAARSMTSMARLTRRLIASGLLALVASLPASASSARAPDRQPVPRPRIGLALGGGSALGLAHIGVLDWLEIHRVPIDAVAGTSMGSFVGGAFASGLTAGDIMRLVDGVDWDLYLRTDVPFASKNFRRKQDSRSMPTALEFGLKGGFTLPRSINTGHHLALLLERIALPYFELASFDDLPTPFRAMATDLMTARQIALAAGSLADAIRGSMALPAVLDPVTLGPYLLIDGGALNNVPADVVRGMGAGVVIAVDVGALARPVSPSKTLIDVLSKTIETVMRENSERAMATADLVIRPDLSGLDSMDFRRAAEIVQRGRDAAEAVSARLLPLAVSEAEYADWRASRERRRRPMPGPPVFITVTGVPAAEQAAVVRHLGSHLGRPIDPVRLGADLTVLTGSDRYNRVSYEAVRDGERVGLLIRVDPRKYGPPFLAIAPAIGTTSSSVFATSVEGRITAYDVAGQGSEVRLGAAAGSELSAEGELYVPIFGSRWFVAPHASAERTFENSVSAGRLVAEYRASRGDVGMGVGFNSGRRSEIRAGFDVSRYQAVVRVGDPDLPGIHGTERVASLQWVFDNQDSAMVPTRGVYASVRIRQFLRVADVFTGDLPADIDYPRRFRTAEAQISGFGRPGSRNRLFGVFGGGTSFGAAPVAPNDFALGGPFRLGAYHRNELRGSQYLLLTGGFLREVGRLPDMLGEGAYLGAWVENGATFDSLAGARWRTNISGGLVLETLVGPVIATGSVGLDGRARIYVGVGRLLR